MGNKASTDATASSSSNSTTASAGGPIKPPQVQFYLRSLRRLEEEVLPEEERNVKRIEAQAKMPIIEDPSHASATSEAKEKDGDAEGNNGGKISEAERREKERLLAYEALMRKLVETDGYSADDDDLRRKRKEVVTSIQSLMDRLEALRPRS
jgi:hypothetical protein